MKLPMRSLFVLLMVLLGVMFFWSLHYNWFSMGPLSSISGAQPTGSNGHNHSTDNTWDEEQQFRRAQVRQACQSLEKTDKSSVNSTHTPGTARSENEELLQFVTHWKNLVYLYYNDEHRFIYCEVPKVASTLWKKLLILIQDPKNRTMEDLTRAHAHGFHNLTQFNMLNSEEVVFRLKTFKKFLVVRDPFERLFSAYRSKFTNEAIDWVRTIYDETYGHEWISVLRDKNHANESLKFEEMLEILTRRGLPTDMFNRHWKPIFDMCHPCILHYDYIANFTTLERDSNEILERVLSGSSRSGLRFPKVKKSNSRDRLRALLPGLDPDLVRGVQKTYHEDYKLFG